MKIALVHPFCWPEVRRGAERYLDDLSWYLTGAGHQVEVVTGTYGRSSLERATNLTTRQRHHIGASRLQRFGLMPFDTFGLSALPTLASHRYDVVHCLAPSSALAARLTGHRTVFTVLGHPTPGTHGGTSTRERLLRHAISTASVVTALSSASRDAVHQMYGRDSSVLPPGIRLDRFDPRLEPRTGGPRILFASALDDRRKGLDVAFRAFARLRSRRPDARLVLAGPGDARWAFESLDEEGHELRDAVELVGVGEVDDVADQFKEATVTILPARDEAFGLVLVESLASGTPVVCADQGGMPEIVSGGDVGRVVPFGDDVALCDAIDQVIEMAGRPGTPRRCAEHARQWDWQSAVGPAHEQVYTGVAR